MKLLLTTSMNRTTGSPRIRENQDFAGPKPISMFSLDLEKRRAEFEAQHGKCIEHEFQQLGRELEPIFGTRIWADFHRAGTIEAKGRRAYEICKKREMVKYPLFRGVLRNL